jgi:predicted MarR family transcription regulator
MAAALERVGLVEPRREGREVHYTVQAKRLEEAIEAITRVASTWDARLLAIKRIAEQMHREQIYPEQARSLQRRISGARDGSARSACAVRSPATVPG